MTTTVDWLNDLEARVIGGARASADDARQVLACADLVGVGALGEALRKAWRGDRVTFGRVAIVAPGGPADAGHAGELRLAGSAASPDDARRRVQEAAAAARGIAVTGFTPADLEAWAGGDHVTAAEIAAALRSDGLDALADVPIDPAVDFEHAVELLRAVARGGLGTWRATIHDAPTALARLPFIERAAALQAAGAGFRAFAPLPRVDAVETPSTGYDDVRTIAVARLLCRDIPAIQVDWQLYGPKLAQVAITYGADDIDAVPAHDLLQLGHRRSPKEDLERQIRAAFAEPAERDGRYEARP